MKKFNLTLLLLLPLGIISCQEEDRPDEPDFISSNINEVNWNGIPETRTYQQDDSLVLYGVSKEQDLDKLLSFKIKFDGEGEYTLNKSTHYITFVQEHVETSLYRLDESTTSQLIITEYDSEQNIIKGNFEMSLLLESGDPENHGNRLVFSNGRFKATIDN